MSNKNITEELLNANEISKDTKIIVSNFNRIQKGIENNTDALQELRNALTASQTALKDTGNAEESGLDKIKKIILAMDTLQSITSRFKNVGRGKMFPLIHCYCFKMPTIICVLWDTRVFILSFVRYTDVNEASICGETGTL